MSTFFYVKKGDTLPTVLVQLTDSTGDYLVLTGATVRFKMKPAGGGSYKVDAAATITDALLGKVSYTFTSTDTDTVGDYYVEWVVTLSGTTQTVPTDTYKIVTVTPTLADTAVLGTGTGAIGTGVNQAYTTVQDEGTPVTQRSTLNFVGSGVSVADTSGVTTVTVSAVPLTLAAVGAAPNANGATVSSGVLNLEPASASFPGVVTTAAQTIAGQKDFSNVVRLPNIALASLPAAAAGNEGALAYDTTNSTLQLSDGAVWSTLSPTETQSDVTLYVETTGSDTNDGTIGSPLLTIQAAIDRAKKLGASQLKHRVTIQVGSGNFTGFALYNINTAYATNTTNGSYFLIKGTYIAPTLTTGTASGTATAGSAGSSTSGTQGTMTDSGQAWTTDELRGKLLEIVTGTGSGQIFPILSNTGTVITVASPWTAPASGSTYAIREYGTIITTGIPRPAQYGVAVSSSDHGLIAFDVYGPSQTGNSIYIEGIKFNISRMQLTKCDRIAFQNCHFNPSVSGTNITVGVGARAFFNRNYFSFTTTAPSSYLLMSAGNLGASATNCLFYNGTTAINMAGNVLAPIITSCTFFGQSTAAMTLSTPQVTGLQIVSSIFNGNSAGGKGITQAQSSAGFGFGLVGLCRTSYFTGWATAIELREGCWFDLDVYGTSNTTAMNFSRGADVRVSAASTLTGTTEVSIDGTSSALATMRAASPKVISDANYHTKFFE